MHSKMFVVLMIVMATDCASVLGMQLSHRLGEFDLPTFRQEIARGHLTANEQRLIESAFVGDVDAVRQVLDEDIMLVPDTVDVEGTALHWAAARGHVEVIGLLLERGMRIDVRSGQRNLTALDRAMELGHQNAAIYLINNGANTESFITLSRLDTLFFHNRVLLLDVIRGNIALIEQDLDHPIDDEVIKDAIFAAIGQGCVVAVQLLLRHIGDRLDLALIGRFQAHLMVLLSRYWVGRGGLRRRYEEIRELLINLQERRQERLMRLQERQLIELNDRDEHAAVSLLNDAPPARTNTGVRVIAPMPVRQLHELQQFSIN